jgi:hypothetical protein
MILPTDAYTPEKVPARTKILAGTFSRPKTAALKAAPEVI